MHLHRHLVAPFQVSPSFQISPSFTPLLMNIKEVLRKAKIDSAYVGEARATALAYVAERRLVTPKDAMYAVGIFKLAKDPDSVLNLVESLLAGGGAGGDGRGSAVVDTALFNNAIDVCAKAAAWQTALGLLRRMHAVGVAADTISFSSAISACAKAGQWQEAKDLLDEMSAAGVIADTICYSAVISACAGAGRWQESLQMLAAMKRNSVAVDAIAVNSAIAACGAAGKWSVALRLVDFLRSEGLRPNAYTYAATIAACDSGGQYDAALQLLEVMLREREETEGPPSEVPFNAAIAAAVRGNRLTQAVALFRRMEVLGVKRTAVTYTTLVSGLAKARWRYASHPALVLDLVAHQMVRDGVPRNGAVFGAAISGAERLDDHASALQLLDAMKAEGVPAGSYVYHSAMAACSRAGLLDRAVALLHEMKELGVPRTGVTYSLLIGGCKAGGRWQDALRFLADMEDDVRTTNSGEVAADGSASDGDGDGDGEGDTSMRPDTVAYSSAISVCVASKQWEVALELLEKMEGAGVQRNVVTYNTVIEALSAAGETVRAELVYQRALSVGVYNHWHPDSPYHTYHALQALQAAQAAAVPTWPLPGTGGHEPVAVMDLHQFPVAVARAAVMNVLGEMCMGGLPVGDPLVIITGRGNHVNAKSQRGVLKRQLLHMCAEMGLQLLSDGAAAPASSRPANPGRLWLTRAALEEWLAAQKADDDRRRAQGSVHGNLFLQVARAKHSRAAGAVVAAATAAVTAGAALGSTQPINVRAACPFSSATLPREGDAVAAVEAVAEEVAVPSTTDKRVGGCPAHAARDVDGSGSGPAVATAPDPPLSEKKGGGCPSNAAAQGPAAIAVAVEATPAWKAHDAAVSGDGAPSVTVKAGVCPAHASAPPAEAALATVKQGKCPAH